MFVYWGGPSWGKGEILTYSWINNSSCCWFNDTNVTFYKNTHHKINDARYDICSLDVVTPYSADKSSQTVYGYYKKQLDFNNYTEQVIETFPQISEDHLIHYKLGNGDTSKSRLVLEHVIKNESITDRFKVQTVDWISWNKFIENNDIHLFVLNSRLKYFIKNKLSDELNFILSKTKINLVPYREYNCSDQNIEQFIHKLHMFNSGLYGYKSIFQVWKRSKEKIFQYLDHYIVYMRNVEKFLIKNNIEYQYYNLDDTNRFDVLGYKNYVDYDFHHCYYDLSNPIIREKYEMAKEMVIEWFESRKIKDSRLEYASIDGLIDDYQP